PPRRDPSTSLHGHSPTTPPYLHFFFHCHLAHGDLHSFPTRRSSDLVAVASVQEPVWRTRPIALRVSPAGLRAHETGTAGCIATRSEEHTSELQSRGHLVCRLLLEKKKHVMQFMCSPRLRHSGHVSVC